MNEISLFKKWTYTVSSEVPLTHKLLWVDIWLRIKIHIYFMAHFDRAILVSAILTRLCHCKHYLQEHISNFIPKYKFNSTDICISLEFLPVLVIFQVEHKWEMIRYLFLIIQTVRISLPLYQWRFLMPLK